MKTQVYRIRLTTETHQLLKLAAAIDNQTQSQWLEKAIRYMIAGTMDNKKVEAMGLLLKAVGKRKF